jgi:hypothetical protein
MNLNTISLPRLGKSKANKSGSYGTQNNSSIGKGHAAALGSAENI